jgi:predicted kinase
MYKVDKERKKIMHLLRVMVGLSGSGKTTYAKECADENTIVISSDDLREELLSDVNDQSKNGLIFETMFNRTVENLNSGKNVVYDATNLNSKRRASLIKRVRAAVNVADLTCMAIVMGTPFEDCLTQNKNRERRVPTEVLIRQLCSFQVPTDAEDFDYVVLYDTKPEKERLIYHLEHIRLMAKTNHDNPHHWDTVLEHSLGVTTNMLNKPHREYDRDFIVALGMCHDIGKPWCRIKGTDGYSHYNGHDAVSAYMAMTCVTSLSPSMRLYLAEIIGYHMKKFHYNNIENYEKWKSSLHKNKQAHLTLLENADKANSIP